MREQTTCVETGLAPVCTKKKKKTNECQVEQTESLNTNVTFSSC